MRIKIAIKLAYYNTLENMHGFQIQPEVDTIQGILNKAILKTNLVDINDFQLEYAGRTDHGVNALSQVISFFLSDEISKIPDRMLFQINANLPKNIRCWAYSRVSEDFHPRFQAVERTYWYIWYDEGFDNLDFDEMNISKEILTGKHNYGNFSKKDREVQSTFRQINSIAIEPVESYILFRIVGQSFLWQQCRRIVSHLIQIGKKESSSDETKKLLTEFPYNNKPFPLSPENLILKDISYSGIIFIKEKAILKKIIQDLNLKILTKKKELSLVENYRSFMSTLI